MAWKRIAALAAGCVLAALFSPALAACPGDAEIEALVADWQARTPASAPQVKTMEDALCAQEKLIARLQETLGEPVGYKAGLTSKPAQERFGVTAPVRGVLLEGMLLEDGAEVPAAFGARPLFEADLLVRVADEGVNEAKTPEEVLRHVSEVRPFIELPDLVLAEGETMDGPVITAINVGARQGVTGAPIAVERTPEFLRALADMTVTLTDSSGKEIVSAPGKAVLGHPLNAIVWLVGNGMRLKPGDLVSVGSFGPLTPTKPGETVTARYEGLPGNPSVSVRFK